MIQKIVRDWWTNNPTLEYDVYLHHPTKRTFDHRLSIHKKEDHFELYEFYYNSKRINIITSGKLEEVVKKAESRFNLVYSRFDSFKVE